MAPSPPFLQKTLQTLSLSKSKKPPTKRTYQQRASRLFILPPEIRETIWRLALLPPPESENKPHFHIYDTVYDSCTYGEPKTQALRKHRQRNPTQQISLLLTCRAAYQEALQFLYDDAEFSLVLFAGRARPDEGVYGRNCLGSIADCGSVFARMRKVTLIIQPGRRPQTEKYVARIEEVLRTMHFCKEVKELTLHFNFHGEFFTMEDCSLRLERIMTAFHVLANKPAALTIQTCALYPFERFQELQTALPGSELRRWCKVSEADDCLLRGLVGKQWHSELPPTRRRQVAEWSMVLTVTAGWFVFFPVTIPLTARQFVKRKRDKGEW